MAKTRAILVIVLLTLVTLVLIPLQWVALKANLGVQRKLPWIWHRIATRIVGIRLHHVGAPATLRPLLLTPNHVSWLDITVLGAALPLSFIAKSEVKSWPIFGLFAVLQRTVFVNRTKRSETGQVTDEIARRLTDGDVMVLFAEGTSNDGNSVLPFRSALMGAATRAMQDGQTVCVQPLSIAYTRLHGLPMGRQFRPVVAWYGDMEMAGHLWRVLREGAIDVVLTWGEPVEVHQGVDRKVLTEQLNQSVRKMTAGALSGLPEVARISAETPENELFSQARKPAKAGAN